MAGMRSHQNTLSAPPTPLSAPMCRITANGKSAGTCPCWATWGSGNWVAIASRSSVLISNRHLAKGLLGMKVLLVSFAVGLFVGVLYGVIRVKSPAPPIVALLGLLGMVLGEQLGTWILAKQVSLTHAASACLVGESYHSAASVQNAFSVPA